MIASQACDWAEAILLISTRDVFTPLLETARYRGRMAGAGPAKSWFFVELLVEPAPPPSRAKQGATLIIRRSCDDRSD